MTRKLIPDLLPSTQYAVQVRAVGPDSVSEWSQRLVFTTIADTIKPAIPANITWVPVGNSFHAEFDKVTQNINGETIAVNRYEIELNDGSTTKIDSVLQATGSTKVTYDLTFQANKALFGTAKPSISMRVRTVDNKDFKGDWSTPILTATNAAPAPPAAPAVGAWATPGTDSITLAWTPPADDDIAWYNVYTGATAGFTPNPSNRIYQGQGNRFTYTTTTYTLQYFKIASVDVFGQESTYVSTSATPISPFGVDSTAPAVPTALAASIGNIPTNTAAYALISWTMASPPSDLAGFVVRYRKQGSSDSYNFITFDKNQRSAMISDLLANQNYEFAIQAFDWTQNYSAWSGTVTANAPANAAPPTVVGVTVVGAKNSVTVSWTESTADDVKNGAGLYEVQIDTTSAWSTPLTYRTGAPTLFVSGLDSETRYYARVKAVDSLGVMSSSWSGTSSAYTLPSYEAYSQSRGMNLLTNGNGMLGKVNFSSWSLVTGDVPEGTVNAFTRPAGSSSGIIDEFIAVDPTRTYKLVFQCRQIGDQATNPTMYSYIGCYDVSGLSITSQHHMYIAGTTTTLAAPLNPGDTTVSLTNSANWRENVAASYQRGIIFWDYVDANGKAWGQETYSRNVYYDLWPQGVGSINYTTHVITLAAPWAGPAKPAGTKLSNASSGGTYKYVGGVGNVVPTTWTLYSGNMGGVDYSGGNLSNKFAPGTAQVKIGWLLNYSSKPLSQHAVANIWFSELAAANIPEIAAAQATADGKNEITFSTVAPGSTPNSIGDIWFVRATSSSPITAQYEGMGGTTWTAKTLDNAVIANLNVGKLVSGTISSTDIILSTTGVIKSADYVAGTTGFKLNSGGLELNTGTVKAEVLKAGTLGGVGGSGVIQVGAGTSLVLNGGYLKSNTYTGTSQATNPSNAGFYLGNDGLRIDQGIVSASALTTGTISGTNTITLSGANAKIVGTGFELSGSGLNVTSGSVNAAALNIQIGENLVPPEYADFEANPSLYSSVLSSTNATATISTTTPQFNAQCLQMVRAGAASTFWTYLAPTSTTYNIPAEPSTAYIVSGYVRNRSAVSTTARLGITWSNGASASTVAVTPTVSSSTWQRVSAVLTSPAGISAMNLFVASDTTTSGATLEWDGIQVERRTGNLTTPSRWTPPGSTRINGDLIRTGSITSTAIAQITRAWPTFDDDGVLIGYNTYDVIADPDGRPAWTINAQGNAEFSNLNVRGNATVGDPNTTTNVSTAQLNITVTTTSGSATITAPDGTFNQEDDGMAITGTGIPGGTTILAYVSDTQATMSANATASGTITATITRTVKNVSSLSSANYVPGGQGWTIRSDGHVEVRSMALNSLDGSAIRAGTLNVSALMTGTLEADIALASTLKTVSNPTEVTAATTNASTTITLDSGTPADQQFTSSDVGISITGGGIPANTKITAVTSGTVATLSAAATATNSAVDVRLYRGRVASLSGAGGLTLTDQYGNDIVKLPTDPTQPNYFAGSINATDLYVKDEFRMFGTNNSLGQGSSMALEGGTYKPATYPSVSFDYVSHQQTNVFDNYSTLTDPYQNDETGAVYDPVSGRYMWTYNFYGTNVAMMYPASYAWQKSRSYASGMPEGYWIAAGGMALTATNVHFLAKNTADNMWKHIAFARSTLDTTNYLSSLDRVLNHFWAHATEGGMSGNPAMTIYGGNTYVAKKNSNSQICIYKYTGTTISGAYAKSTNTGVIASGHIKSLVVGQLDFNGTDVFAVVSTSGNSTAHRQNFVFREGTSEFEVSTAGYHFPTPYDSTNLLGLVYLGSSTNDASGVFQSFMRDGKVYDHTRLGYLTTGSTMTVSQRWRNDGSGGGTIAIGPEGPIGTISYKRRSRFTITSKSSIPNTGGNSPNALTFVIGQGSGTRYRYDEPPAGVIQQTFDQFRTTDASGTNTAMGSGVPAKFFSNAGLEINGDGTIIGTSIKQTDDVPATVPTFTNSWVQSTTGTDQITRYWKKNGVVHVDGIIQGGTLGSGTPAFTLPAGCRPAGNIQRSSIASGNVVARIQISSGGAVSVVSGSSTWTSVGFSFVAEQ